MRTELDTPTLDDRLISESRSGVARSAIARSRNPGSGFTRSARSRLRWQKTRRSGEIHRQPGSAIQLDRCRHRG